MEVASLFATLGLKSDEQEWNTGHELVENLKRAVEALAVYEGFKHIVEAFNGVAESVEHAELAAQALGTTSEAVQELAYATKLIGLNSEESEMGLTHLARAIEEAKQGNQEASLAFQRLGISMSDSAIKSGDTSKIMDRVADAFAKLPDGATKTALAMDLFSRSGAAMIPLLDKGSAGLAQLRAEAHETGNVIGGEAAESLTRYTEATRHIDATFDGLKKTLAVALAPAVGELAEKFQAWLGQHHDQLIEAVVAAAKDLSSSLTSGAEVVAFLAEHGAELEAVLAGLAGAMLGFGVQAAVAWVLALGPIELIILGVAAIGAGVVELIKHWDQVKRGVTDAWHAVEDFGRDVGDFFIDVWQGIGDALKAVFEWLSDLPVIKQLIEVIHAAEAIADKGVRGAIQSYDRTDATPEGALDRIDDRILRFFGAGDATTDATHPANTYSAPISSTSYGTTVAPGAVQIQIDAGNADANQTAQIARQTFHQELSTVLRDAHAGTGGRDR